MSSILVSSCYNVLPGRSAFPRKKEKAPDPISYGTEDFRGATHVAGTRRPLLCAVRGAPPGSSPQAPKVEKRFCPAGFHQPPALSEGAAAASFLMAYMGIVYPIPPQIASPVPGLSYCAPALGNRTKGGWLQSGKESMAVPTRDRHTMSPRFSFIITCFRL